MMHGDDYVAVGPRQNLVHLNETLENKYKIKTEELGREKHQKQELQILKMME